MSARRQTVRKEMNNMNWKRLLGAGVAIGILLILVQHTLQIDSKVFQIGLLIFSIVLFVAVLIVRTTSGKDFRKRVQKQMAMMQAGKPAEALADMEQMLPELQGKKNQHTAALCRLNMTAAHRELKQYSEALEILEQLDAQEFEGIEKVVYLLNLCSCYFYLDQDEKGLELYTANKELFVEYDQHKRYGGSIAALLMFSKIAEGKADQARRLLSDAKIAWTDRRSQQDYVEVERKLAAAEAAASEASEEAAESAELPEAAPAEETL